MWDYVLIFFFGRYIDTVGPSVDSGHIVDLVTVLRSKGLFFKFQDVKHHISPHLCYFLNIGDEISMGFDLIFIVCLADFKGFVIFVP